MFTGAYAINPVNGEKIPIWIADYVLATYGTGAIMAVPGHDERDFEFAKQFGLPIVTVVEPTDEWLKQTGSTLDDLTEAYCEDGVAVNSGLLDGLPTPEAKAKIIAWLEESRLGHRRVNYKLRDWLFSRQRYWGEPFPVLHGPNGETGRACPTSELPLVPPDLEDFKPTGTPEGPLSKATDWVNVDDRRQEVPARDEHDAAVGRVVLVLPALHRPEERQGVRRPREARSTGCRSICTSAGRSTPCCTCCTRGSGTRCSSTAGICRAPSRSSGWSTRA